MGAVYEGYVWSMGYKWGGVWVRQRSGRPRGQAHLLALMCILRVPCGMGVSDLSIILGLPSCYHGDGLLSVDHWSAAFLMELSSVST